MPICLYMDTRKDIHTSPEVDFLHDIGSRMAAADPFHEVLAQVVTCAVALVKCDSCFVYVLDGQDLILRASKNPHAEEVDRLKLRVGQGITGWVAAHRTAVAISENASEDPRFQFFNELPEDTYQAFLSVPLVPRPSGGRYQSSTHKATRLPSVRYPADFYGRLPGRRRNRNGQA